MSPKRLAHRSLRKSRCKGQEEGYLPFILPCSQYSRLIRAAELLIKHPNSRRGRVTFLAANTDKKTKQEESAKTNVRVRRRMSTTPG